MRDDDLIRRGDAVAAAFRAAGPKAIHGIAALPAVTAPQGVDAPDYDAGLMNDWGGGNVDWWQDYIRAEIGRANEHWRSQLTPAQPAPLVHPDLTAEIAALEAALDALKRKGGA